MLRAIDVKVPERDFLSQRVNSKHRWSQETEQTAMSHTQWTDLLESIRLSRYLYGQCSLHFPMFLNMT